MRIIILKDLETNCGHCLSVEPMEVILSNPPLFTGLKVLYTQL